MMAFEYRTLEYTYNLVMDIWTYLKDITAKLVKIYLLTKL
jgi:hypothetical protein